MHILLDLWVYIHTVRGSVSTVMFFMYLITFSFILYTFSIYPFTVAAYFCKLKTNGNLKCVYSL